MDTTCFPGVKSQDNETSKTNDYAWLETLNQSVPGSIRGRVTNTFVSLPSIIYPRVFLGHQPAREQTART